MLIYFFLVVMFLYLCTQYTYSQDFLQLQLIETLLHHVLSPGGVAPTYVPCPTLSVVQSLPVVGVMLQC